MSIHDTANLTVTIGDTEYNVSADFTVCPGEPEVRYYADGSGYPGSDPTIDSIDRVKIEECERAIDGDVSNGDPDNWEYLDRDDLIGRPEGIGHIERMVFAELSSGAYDDELFANADGADESYYISEDDYV